MATVNCGRVNGWNGRSQASRGFAFLFDWMPIILLGAVIAFSGVWRISMALGPAQPATSAIVQKEHRSLEARQMAQPVRTATPAQAGHLPS